MTHAASGSDPLSRPPEEFGLLVSMETPARSAAATIIPREDLRLLPWRSTAVVWVAGGDTFQACTRGYFLSLVSAKGGNFSRIVGQLSRLSCRYEPAYTYIAVL